MSIYSIGDLAARATRLTGEYVSTSRVSGILQRLIVAGEVPERRAGRRRVVMNENLPAVDSALGITDQMIEAHAEAAEAVQ